jgi:hypothetical protein
MEALKVSAKDAAAVDKERRKAEKMAAMMAKFDAVSLPLRPSRSVPSIGAQLTLGNNPQEGTLSEKEDAIRVMLVKLNAVDPEDPTTALSQEDITLLYRQLSERQALLREANEKLRQTQEESEGVSRRREEVEQRLESLETEYEELLGRSGPISASVFIADRELLSMGSAERTIKEEEASSADVAQSIEELKVRRWSLERWLGDLLTLAPTRTGQARGSVRCQARHPAERDLGSQASAGTPGAGAEESGDDGREPQGRERGAQGQLSRRSRLGTRASANASISALVRTASLCRLLGRHRGQQEPGRERQGSRAHAQGNRAAAGRLRGLEAQPDARLAEPMREGTHDRESLRTVLVVG